MNKRTLTFVLSSAALLMLASCGKTTTSTTSGATNTDTVPDADKITITYESTTGKSMQPYLEGYIAEFNKAYPQYKAVPTYYSGTYTQLEQDVIKNFSTGTYPDIVQCYPDHVAEYLAAGKAVNLDQFINSTDATVALSAEDKADYVKSYWDEGSKYSVAGTYSLPYSKSTELMFYNKGVLNGLVLNQSGHIINEGKALGQTYFDNLTWEELFNNLCPALVAYNSTLADDKKILKNDQKYNGVVGYDSDDNLFITLAEQYGYKYTSIDATTGKGSADFNNADMKGLMKTFHKAATDGYLISKGSAGGNFVNAYFTAQNLLFSIGSTGGVTHQFDPKNPMDVGVARIPHAAGKDPKVISQGPSLCVLKQGNDEKSTLRAKGAYLLWKTMTTAKNSLSWALNSTGYYPIRQSNFSAAEYLAANNEDEQKVSTVEMLQARCNNYGQKIVNEYFTSPVFVGSSACRTAVSGIMTWTLDKTKTYADADYDTEFNTKYAEAVKGIQ
jgi:multiple sugar transport system substrate-binding protein